MAFPADSKTCVRGHTFQGGMCSYCWPVSLTTIEQIEHSFIR